MRFSTKIGWGATMAALIIGPLLGAAVFFNARSLLLKGIIHQQVQIVSEEVAKIDHALRMAADKMTVIVTDNFLQDFLESPAEHQEEAVEVANELEERAELTGSWDGMLVFDPLGRTVFAPAKGQSCIDALADSPLTRIAFDSAVQGKTYRSDRIVCRLTGRPGIIFAAPVCSRADSDKVVGVVVAQHVWTSIQNILDNVDAAATVHLFNSKGEMIGKRSTDLFDEDPRQLLNANTAWKTIAGDEGDTVLGDSSHGGKNWLVLHSRPGIGGWTLLMEKPLNLMLTPITVLAKNTGLLVFVVLLVMGGLLAIFFRQFIRPLADLIEGVRQVEQGRFDRQVMVRSKDEFGELACSFNAMVDKLQVTRDELIRKEKLAMLGQVAGSISHELRNPLGVMSNAVYYLQTVLNESDESVKEYLGIILAEITRSQHIVGGLLDAVRTRPPDRATHHVDELIGQTLRQCIVPASVTVSLDIPKTIPPLRVDARQMQHVLQNLISNAVESMPEGGTLLIRAIENREKKTVTLIVQDSGHGMTPEVRAQLFQPLYTTKARGISLGLVVAKNLAEANNGRIEVQSEPEKGTKFSIVLPRNCEEGNPHG